MYLLLAIVYRTSLTGVSAVALSVGGLGEGVSGSPSNSGGLSSGQPIVPHSKIADCTSRCAGICNVPDVLIRTLPPQSAKLHAVSTARLAATRNPSTAFCPLAQGG